MTVADDRTQLEEEYQRAFTLLHFLSKGAEMRLQHARRLRESQRRQRCYGLEDGARACDAYTEAMWCIEQCESLLRHCAKLVDTMRGDGLARLEGEIMRELDADRFP